MFTKFTIIHRLVGDLGHYRLPAGADLRCLCRQQRATTA
jgi:hypothetical protein